MNTTTNAPSTDRIPARAWALGWLLVVIAGATTALASHTDGGFIAAAIAAALLPFVVRGWLGMFVPVLTTSAVAAAGLLQPDTFWEQRGSWLLLALGYGLVTFMTRRMYVVAQRSQRFTYELRDRLYQRAVDGAINDSLLDERRKDSLEREFTRAQRYARELSLVVASIDNLELLRARRGEPAVQDALVRLGELFAADTRLPDAGLWAGERLLFMLPETPLLGARVVAERARLKWRALEILGADDVPLTISIGLATYPGDGQRAEDVFDAAEEACDRAVERGGDRTILSRSPSGTPTGWSS